MQTHLTMRYLHNKEAKYSTVLPQIGCFFVPELTCLKLSQLATLETAEELNNLIMKPVILFWQNLGDQNPTILAQDGERSIDVKSRESIIIILKFLSVRLHNFPNCWPAWKVKWLMLAGDHWFYWITWMTQFWSLYIRGITEWFGLFLFKELNVHILYNMLLIINYCIDLVGQCDFTVK